MIKPASVEIDAVVFDLGGVLIEIDFQRTTHFVKSLTPIPVLEIGKRLAVSSVLVDFECGRIPVEEFHRGLERLLECKIPYDTFSTAWNEMFGPEIDSNIQHVRSLRKRTGFKVGLLSNTNLPHFTFLKQRMKVLREMEHVYASHEIGCRKPDPESYRHVLSRMNVAPERSVFVDDLAENLDGARKVGMRTIHAVNPEAVHAGLSELGLV